MRATMSGRRLPGGFPPKLEDRIPELFEFLEIDL